MSQAEWGVMGGMKSVGNHGEGSSKENPSQEGSEGMRKCLRGTDDRGSYRSQRYSTQGDDDKLLVKRRSR